MKPEYVNVFKIAVSFDADEVILNFGLKHPNIVFDENDPQKTIVLSVDEAEVSSLLMSKQFANNLLNMLKNALEENHLPEK